MSSTRKPILQRARQHVAGDQLAEQTRSLDRTRSRIQSILAERTMPSVTVEERVCDRLLAGQLLPEDLGEQLVAQHNATAAQTLELAALGRIEDLLDERLRDLKESTADLGLQFLNRELHTLLRKVEASPDRNDQLRLVDEYLELREAQTTLTDEKANGLAGIGIHSQTAFTRDPADPTYLLATNQITVIPDMISGTKRYEPEIWPGYTDLPPNPLLPSTTPFAYLRWLADRGDAWVPNTSQLSQAIELRHRCIRQEMTPPQLIALEQQTAARNARDTSGLLNP